jgi:hypothetical protein
VPGEDDADRRIVTFDVVFRREVGKIKVYLSNVIMLHVINFEVNQHEAAQDAVVEDAGQARTYKQVW